MPTIIDSSPVASLPSTSSRRRAAVAPVNAADAVKWRTISKAGGETDLALDDYVSRVDADARAAGEAAAKKWLDALKKPRS